MPPFREPPFAPVSYVASSRSSVAAPSEAEFNREHAKSKMLCSIDSALASILIKGCLTRCTGSWCPAVQATPSEQLQ